MDPEFQEFWQEQRKTFDLTKETDPKVVEMIVLTTSYNAWAESKRRMQKTIDQIVCSNGAHEFYKKNPHLKQGES
jgi:hypothetical protein